MYVATPEELEQQEHLGNYAKIHADNSSGTMVLLDYDPGLYPFQKGFYYSGEPMDHAITDTIAHQVRENYYGMVEMLETQEAETGWVSMVGELLKGGNSVELVTNHSDLIDIAVAHAALYSTLQKQGYKMDMGIIISKIITRLGYKVDPDSEDFAPCVEILKMLETEMYFSYPRTESGKKHLIDRFRGDEADKNNKQMRRHVIRKLGEGGLLLAMAASGTTDKPDPNDENKLVLGAIGHGTADIMMADNAFVVGMAIWYKNGKTVMKLADIPRKITTQEEAHDVMHKIVDTLEQEVEGYGFDYAG